MILSRPRLLPLLATACIILGVTKADSLWRAAARAASPPAEAAPAAPPAPTPPVAAPPAGTRTAASAPQPAANPRGVPAAAVTPAEAAEREILTALRARRTEIEARESALAAREVVLAAAERRLTARLDDLAALQGRLEAADRARTEREESGWRGLVRTYEAMRPRDAAAVFDELEMPVLVGIVARMREAKAAPILGAMRPDRARGLTAELSRHRAPPEVAR